MTEFETLQQVHEMTEHLIGLQSAQASYIAIYLTGIFAFILAAHTAGRNLTRFQVSICYSLFSLFSFIIATRIIALGSGMNELLLDLYEMEGTSARSRYQLLDENLRLILATVVWSFGGFSALAFMWSVRHSKDK
jgi:ABC-type dipeptide/oligopeptide/nickel transport system permease component